MRTSEESVMNMRTNEERIAAMHHRAAVLERERRERIYHVATSLAAAACFFMVICLSVFAPRITSTLDFSELEGAMNASLFASAGTLGYVVVGIVAFLLGIALTMFCFRLKKWKDDYGIESDREKSA